VTELDDGVIEEAAGRGETLAVGDLVALTERAHGGERGVPRETLDAYLDVLGEESLVNADALRETLENRVVADREFAGETAVYEVADGRVSAYPGEWHDRLAGASIAEYVDAMTAAMDDPPGSGASPGVAETDLLDAAETIDGRDREAAREELDDLRAEGVLVADADQHPRAGIALAEDVDFEKERWDKPDWGDRAAE
jgi:hypothetical protein